MLFDVKTWLLLFCIGLTTPSIAQPLMQGYQPPKDDSLQLQHYKKALRDQFVKDSLAIKGDYKKQLIQLYKERYEYLKDMIDNKEIVAVKRYEVYLQNILSEIIRNNPSLLTLQPRLLLSRVYWPNASSAGEGTLIFNIDLFAKLQNEAQVAYVLCHELAHLYLNHSNNSINQYVATINSDDFQDALKEIKKQQYEKNRDLDRLEKGLVFKSRRHGRAHENEADSIGLQFLQATRYDVKEAIGTLQILDNIDQEIFDSEKELPAIFGCAELPFKPRWTKKEEAFFGASTAKSINKKEQDSLKTHPDCQQRIQRITPTVNKVGTTGKIKYTQPDTLFHNLQQQYKFEVVKFCFESKMISKTLFYAVKLLKEYPDNPYLINIIGQSFNLMYEYQKDHHLGTITDLPSPYVAPNINTMYYFVQNISLRDIAAINYYFLKKHQVAMASDTAFTATFKQAMANFNQP